jgi:DNA-directed RNA polymerase specialized sigma24 family protein
LVINEQSDQLRSLDSFLVQARPRLERALIARYGIDDGLDAAVEASAYALEHWDRLRSMGNPVGYLYRVGQTRGGRLAQRWKRIESIVQHPLTCDRIVDVDLQRALLQLKPEERIAVVLVYAHGHSYAEAAEILDVPVTAVSNHLTRGLARLRTILER